MDRTLPSSVRRTGPWPLVALLCLLVVHAVLPAPARAQTPRLRMEYLRAQRAYPFADIPAGALQRARHALHARFPDLIRGDRSAATGAAVTEAAWTPLGPDRIDAFDAGRLVAIAIDPRDPSVMYVGGAQGGVWKTLDGGLSWQALSDGQCSLAMGSLALDPVNPDIVYAGTGELHFSGDSYYGCGLLRSLDGGASWQQLGAAHFDAPDGGARISKVLVDPRTAGTPTATVIHVSSSYGVFRSVDSGGTWTLVLEGVATDLVRIAADPRVLFAAVGHPGGSAANGVYRSLDDGLTWQRLSGGFPSALAGRIALGDAPSAPGTLYAAVQAALGPGGTGGNLLGIWRTDDGGGTWRPLEARGANCNTQCWYDLVLAVHPTNPEFVYFGGVSLHRSLNGGARFTDVLNGIHVDQHAIVFHPQRPTTVFVGNDGGLYRTDDAGATWTTLNNGLAITQFYAGISLHADDAQRVLGGTQDNGTLEYFGDPDWTRVLGSDGGFTALDPLDPAIAYAETQWQAGSTFSGPRRRDGPAGFVRRVTGIDTRDRALFIPPLVMDPTDPAVLYFGTYRLYRTADRAELWTPVSGDLSRRGGSISAIAPAPSDPSTLWVGTTDGGVSVSRDLGATWADRSPGLPDRYVRDIDVSRVDPLDAVVVHSGFGSGHVFRTLDGGRTWADLSGDLPDVPVNAVVRHPSLGETILVGTDLGVFASVDGGATWLPYGLDMPNVAVFDLAYHPVTGRVVAATHGRGAFALSPRTDVRVVLARDTVRFAALGDTTVLEAGVLGAGDVEIPGVGAVWRSLDPAVATVDAAGRVVSVGNGAAAIIAAAAGAADTAFAVVEQLAVGLDGVPAESRLVVDEVVTVGAAAVDANGRALPEDAVQLRITDAAVLSLDGRRLAALGEGEAFLVADAGVVRDSTRVRVLPPATLRLEVRDGAPAVASARAATRVPLLRISVRAEGIEAIGLTRVTFDVDSEAGGRLLLVSDANRDGAADAGEAILAAASLPSGASVRVTLEPAGFAVPADGVEETLVVAELAAGAANGAIVRVRFVPEGTASLNTRSLRANRLTQPASAVTSSDVRLSVLADMPLSLSENPVRSTRVIFNFATQPRSAAIYTIDGRRVIDLLRDAEAARVEWDLTNERGARVAPGVYLVVFEIDGRVLREKLVVAAPGEDAAGAPDVSAPERARAPAGTPAATFGVR